MRSDGVVNFGCRFNEDVKKPVMMDLREWLASILLNQRILSLFYNSDWL